ncbi:MAG TPA: thioredoxin domain-containing protein, partial [Longimicrobiales bacterium]|nr:thioredoxin domain-containing protein [Longimicrobiales bacterium]
MKVLLLATILMPGILFAQDGNNRLLERGATGRARGQQGAPVMVYEIADFQCPYCARFAREVFPRIDSAYINTGKVQWFYVNMPLPNHGNAWPAAEAAMCAGAVADKFWPVHDRLYATQAEWTSVRDIGAAVRRLAKDAGVSGDAYEDCLAEDRMSPLMLQDVIFATSTRLSGTPAFI